MLILKRKFPKANKLTAWFLILSLLCSLGVSVWSAPESTEAEQTQVDAEQAKIEAEENQKVDSDVPKRSNDELLALMGEPYAAAGDLELYVLKDYKYTGEEGGHYADVLLYDSEGKLIIVEYSEYADAENTQEIKVYDRRGNPVMEDGEHMSMRLNQFKKVKITAGEIPEKRKEYAEADEEEEEEEEEEADSGVGEEEADGSENGEDGEEADGESEDGEDSDGESEDGEDSDGDSDEDDGAESAVAGATDNGDDSDGDSDNDDDSDENSDEDDSEASDDDEGEEADGSEATDGGEAVTDPDAEGIDPNEEITLLTYSKSVPKKVEKVKEEGVFAIKVKSKNPDEEDYIWWSNPIDAARDPAGAGRIASISSTVEFREGNPETHTANTIRSNNVSSGKFTNNITKIEKINNGARFHYHFPQTETSAVMEVVLDNGSVLVTIPQSGIKEGRPEKVVVDGVEKRGSILLSLSLLNSFGAAKAGEEGYVVVPDGSGAVIEFDNGKVSSAQYSGQVYGRDYSVSMDFAPPVSEQVYMPVFGIVRDNNKNALVAIAEKGDENATIRASVSNQTENTTGYNLAWFDFKLRTEDQFRIGNNNDAQPIYESGDIKTGDIAVRYYPVTAEKGQELSYVDVADTYREYLIAHKGLSAEPKPGVKDLSFYATLNGGTIKTHSIAGFPFNLQTEATTYSQADEIVNKLKQSGVSNLILTYNDFNSLSIKRKVAAKVKYPASLGGKSDFGKLSDNINQSGFIMYPSMGFMEFQKSGGGYSSLRHAPREVTRSRAIQRKYELAFKTPDKLQKVSAILSPYYFEKAFDSIAKSLKEEGIDRISLDSATYVLYSDFSRKKPDGSSYFNRKDTVGILKEGYKKLNAEGISIMAQTANAYALPYVSHISNVPLTSSNYDLFDYDVPFYQMVIQGLIPYTSEPFNASANLDAMTLKAIATGTPPHYEFMYTSPSEFDDSLYNKKFYSDYEKWVDDSITVYNSYKNLVGNIIGERIVSYKRLSADEYETKFESGTKITTITINLSTHSLKIDGKSFKFEEGVLIDE